MPIQPKQQPPYYQPTNELKTYKANLSQSGTNAPTAAVMIDTYNITSLTRTSEGRYRINKTGAFTNEKTWSMIDNNTGDPTVTFTLIQGTDYIQIWVDAAGTPSDDWLSNTSIIIQTYN